MYAEFEEALTSGGAACVMSLEQRRLQPLPLRLSYVVILAAQTAHLSGSNATVRLHTPPGLYTTAKKRCAKGWCAIKWRCHLSQLNKVCDRRNTKCEAMIDIKVKKLNASTRKTNPFLRRDPPLCAIIKLKLQHNHSVESAEALHHPRCSIETRALFLSYFTEGMSPAEAISLHEGNLAVEDDTASVALLANGAVNPIKRTVYHLHEAWQRENHGPILDPLTKLQEKLPVYADKGVDVRIQVYKETGCWAALVTSIMS